MKLKERCRKGKCCCAGCKATAAENHELPDGKVWFCSEHVKEAWQEYEECGIVPEVEKIAEDLPEPEIGLTSELARQIQADQQSLDQELTEIGAIEISTQEELEFAESEIRKAAERWKAYEEKRTAATSPLNQSLREINGWFKPVQTALKSLENGWKAAIGRYVSRKHQEQQRLLAEAQAAMEATEIREKLVSAAETAPVVTAVTFVDRWVFEVADPEKLPREYLCPDMEKIAKVVGALHDKHGIPGVEARNEPIARRK
jgi:hypothetical protein